MPKPSKDIPFSSISGVYTIHDAVFKMCRLEFRFQNLPFSKSAGKNVPFFRVNGRPIRHIFHHFLHVTASCERSLNAKSHHKIKHRRKGLNPGEGGGNLTFPKYEAVPFFGYLFHDRVWIYGYGFQQFFFAFSGFMGMIFCKNSSIDELF